MLLDYKEDDVQDRKVVYEIVPFEISLPGDFCFTDDDLSQAEGNEYPSASAAYSEKDDIGNVVELKRTDFLECYDELSREEEPSAIAMPLARINDDLSSLVILVERSATETPLILDKLDSKGRACSIADEELPHNVNDEKLTNVSSDSMDVYMTMESNGNMSDTDETPMSIEIQKEMRNMAIYRWQEKKILQRSHDKCGKSARQEATARRPRCNGRFNKVKAKWVVATEYFHPKLRRDKSDMSIVKATM
jgi:hypothetical protein